MGTFRLFRHVRVAPGLAINLAKTGPSLSLGARGAHVTLSRTGIRKTVGCQRPRVARQNLFHKRNAAKNSYHLLKIVLTTVNILFTVEA